MTIHWVRHAKAEKRAVWDGPPALRPLTFEGLRQADALAERLRDAPITRVLSSAHLRCRQTVGPLAAARGLRVEIDERLGEGERPAKALALLQELSGGGAVCCAHGDLVAAVVAELEETGAILETAGALRWEKGSVWELDTAAVPARARYRPPPPVELGAGAGVPRRFGVLDLGSTSFRLLVADVTDAGHLTPISSERIMLRLGAAIALDGRLPEPVCAQAVETAGALGEVARRAGVERLLPVGTAALRDAENGRELAEGIAAALGTPVRVIGGEEEARLMFAAFRRRVLLPRGPVLGVDLGGGSLELALGDDDDVHWETTLRIGVTRLHRELLERDPPRKRELRAVRERVRDLVAPHRDIVLAAAPRACIAVGGTARALARLLAARRGSRDGRPALNGLVMSVDELRELARELGRLSHDERVALPGMRKPRADLLPAGAAILATLGEELGLAAYTVSDWGLREGVILEALQAAC